MKYLYIKNNKIIGKGIAQLLDDEIVNLEVSDEIFNNFEKYIFKEGKIIENPDYEAELAAIERNRLDSLTLTAADVERAIYKARGMDFEDILNLVKDNPEIDLKALKIELKANNFYRGNPYVNQIGALLGFSSEELDYLFENGELAQKEDDNAKMGAK